MLLVAYLRKGDVQSRALHRWERDLLGPMIRRSDNAAASAILGLVGSEGVYGLARVADMTSFRLHLPIWGQSEITARDQARFFRRIDSYVPRRHRAYALRLLASIVPSQRWSIARAAPPGWKLYFKGGWSSGTGLVDHQVGLLRTGGERVSLAVLTRFNPDHAYGKETLRGVALRLLRGLPRPRLAVRPVARFAFSRGYAAWLDVECATLRIRALGGKGVAIPTAADGCAFGRLALAGPRALWSESADAATRVLTATLGDPAPTELATLGAGETLRQVVGRGAALAFSYDSSDGEGRLVFVGGPTCAIPAEARIALGVGGFAVAAAETLEVRDSETCELVAALHPSGNTDGVSLAGDLLAAHVRGADGATRIVRYRVSSAERLGSTRVSPRAAPSLRVSGDWIVYRVGRRIALLGGAPARKRALWRPRHREVGLTASGPRIAWFADSSHRGRLWTLALPR
jgi:hypothetical protein